MCLVYSGNASPFFLSLSLSGHRRTQSHFAVQPADWNRSIFFFARTVFTHEGKNPRHMRHRRPTIRLEASPARGPVKSPETCRIWQLSASGASSEIYHLTLRHRPENECTLLFFLRDFPARTPAFFFALHGIKRRVIQRPQWRSYSAGTCQPMPPPPLNFLLRAPRW